MPEPSRIHRTLGRYQLLVAIARGGMGEVWLGRLQGARGFNKLVAVKTLLPNTAEGQRFESMLTEEARIASLIQHANVVHTMELGEEQGLLYLVMEWVDGEPLGFLSERADARGGMSLNVATNLIAQVLAGLHAAHELSDDSGPLGVVHRDVSPHNILVTYDGVAKLLDFGIAKATHQSAGNTEAGEIKGKFSYMAPEQILAGDVDRRCDVFAAGIVLYLLTTGTHPFKRHNTAATIRAITSDDPVPPPSSLVEDYPAELEQVVLKALDKRPEHRWATAEEMRSALKQAMPDAFADAGQQQLREFMNRAVGDRKHSRREAVRRAQLAADASDVETGARRALQASGQSASSLQAIAISQPAPAEVSEIVSARTGESSAVVTPAPKPRVRVLPWAAAGLGLVLTLIFSAPRLFDSSSAPNQSGVSAGAPLVAREPATAVAAPPSAAAPAASAAAPTPPVSDAAPAATPAIAAPPTVASAAKPRAKAASSQPAAKRADKAKTGAASDELLAPDYAR
jgi:serine/threonine protein kinase